MKNRLLIAGSIGVVCLAAYWQFGRNRAAADESSAATTSRQGVELTVYKQDFGMVHEQRPAQLDLGDNKLQVQDVSKQLDPQSVLLGWTGGQAQITAHSYDLGVADGDRLLKRYLGKQVEVVRYGDNGHEAERQKGRLMVEAGGSIVLQEEGKFYVHPQGTIVAPTDRNIVTIPQLSVQALSSAKQSGQLEVTYLTRGLYWSSDYVATLSPKDDSLKLECWATVTNRTGADYPNAKVSLVAGSPNRAAISARARIPAFPAGADFLEGHAKWSRDAAGIGATRAVFPAESLGEFHEYRIQSPTTIVQEQMNRLLMLGSDKVLAKRDYNTRLPGLSVWDDIYSWGTPAQPKHGNVSMAMSFYNETENGLGEPLPQGAIRIYEPDKTGSLRYTGAANIPDTPKDQKVDVTLASAFDVFTEYRVVKSQKVAKRTVRKQIEVTLHNEKAGPVNLRVVQSFSGRWKIITESNKHQNLNAYETQWTVPIPAGGKAPLTYEVEMAE